MMATKKTKSKPIYYKPTKRPVKKRYFLLLLLIPIIIAGVWFISRAQEQLKVITESPTVEAEMKVPPTPAVLSDDEGYLEEAFVTDPTAFSYSDPKNFGFKTYLMVAGENADSFEWNKVLRFPRAKDYSPLLGVTTYRGNNYRNSATFGTARIESRTLTTLWSHSLPEFPLSGEQDGTAQPLIVQWPADLMETMAFKSAKKDKVQLTEVIFADKSGHLLFFDLDDGEYSRTPLPTIAYTEGTPTLDPRGYPLLYVGQTVQEDGDVTHSRYQYFYVYDLVKEKRAFRFGSASVEPFSNNKWQGYTGSPLVYDNRVFIMGESGILYAFDFNAEFDLDTGELFYNTEPALTKYKYENENTGYFVTDDEEETQAEFIENGTMGSLAGYKDYVFFSDRSGFLQCVDINHMALVYAVDLKGNGDSTVCIEDEGEDSKDFYIYSGTRLNYLDTGAEGSQEGTVYFRKIEGLTGKVLWENTYTVVPAAGSRSGITETALVGKNNLSRYVYFAVVNEQSAPNTRVYCVEKSTGEVVWRYYIEAASKSVPVAMYDKNGLGYIIMGDLDGNMVILDGRYGGVVSQITLKAGVDGCPAVFNNKIVVHLNNDTLVCVKME